MRFALIDHKQTEAAPGLRGSCPGCAQPLIARCGQQRMHHWAHAGNKMCDTWWEPETEWHRSWKNNFPAEWQEYFLTDEKGEKHIADVRTGQELVIEFQHSHIDPLERSLRERFYKNMVWVVDGTRLKRDYHRFLKGQKDFCHTDMPGMFIAQFPDECFPSSWLKSLVPVVFDFKGIGSVEDSDNRPDHLYCLFPNQGILDAHVAEIPRKAFINSTINGEWSLRVQKFKQGLDQKRRDQEARRNRLLGRLFFQRFSGVNRYRRSRRF